jgi:chitodextrinase
MALVSCSGDENGETDITRLHTYNLTVSNITSTSATITWDSDIPATSQVWYSKYPDHPPDKETPLNNTLTVNHKVIITGLSPDTSYNYLVVSSLPSGMTVYHGAVDPFTTMNGS